jgi:hypothetical protein
VIRLGAPTSDPAGCCLESTFKGHQRRLTIRAWHPLVNIPTHHFTLEELAHALGLIVPARAPQKRGKNKI